MMLKNKDILLIEDDSIDVMSFKRALVRLEIKNNVRHVENGEEALAYLSNSENSKPGIIFMDINMPRMTGIDLAERLQREDVILPFGFVTSEGTKEMRERAKNAGALFLIAKPFTVGAFEEALTPLIPSIEAEAATGETETPTPSEG